MAEQIERTIYRLELDGAGYIQGVEALANSTKKLNEAQEATNKTLKINEAALKANSDRLAKAKKDLEDYAGTNARYRKQLEKDIVSAENDQKKLTELVNGNRIAYEKATKAAQTFADATARANALQGAGGKIQTGPSPAIAPPIVPFDTSQLTDLPDILNATKDEFDQLRIAIAAAEAQLESLDEESEEFKQLSPIVSQAKESLKLYDQAAKQTAGSQQSLRTQLRLGREELVRLEQQGKANTTQYFELEKRVAKLTDEFSDQQERIKVLASDTRLLDFGKASIQAATAAFQTYASVAILVGEENEELQKKTMQLFAAMQLLTSLEQLSNSVKRGSVIATNAQSAAQAIYTSVVGASTGALRVFRLALLGTGIGAVVVLIGLLAKKYIDLKNSTDEAAEKQKKLNDVIKQAESDYTRAVSSVNELRTNIQLAKEGIISKEQVVKQYNETIGKTTGEVKSLDEAEKALGKNADAYIQFTLLKAAANVALGEAAKKAFEISQELNKPQTTTELIEGSRRGRLEEDAKKLPEVIAAYDKANKAFLEGNQEYKKFFEERDALVEAYVQKNLNPKLSKDQDQFLKIAQDFQRKAATIAKDFKFNFFETKDTKETENVFIQERDRLNERLAQLRAKEATDEAKIIAQFQESLTKELNRLAELRKDKKLTGPQLKILDAKAIEANKIELDKALADFRKKITDAREKLNDELRELEQRNIDNSINLIKDEFERRAAAIDANEQKELSNTRENIQDRLDSLELDRLLIGEQAYQEARERIASAGEKNILNITQKFANDRKNLAADTFQKSLVLLNEVFEEQLLEIDEQAAAKILEQKALFAKGEINYQQFQKNITKILKDEKEARDKLRLQELNSELEAINKRLEITDNAEEKAKLKQQQRAIRKEISDINKQTPGEDPDKQRLDKLVQYANSIGELAQSVVSFWEKVDEAESAALDRSIALQERRVEAAQRIAERGNAEYLRAEEDRLNELNVKRENAARRQLAIDAALQASQILVGITGAIAKIATPGIGIAESIAAMAVIVGSLAAGYGLVKSLQGNQPRLAEGTTYVSRGKNPSGKDTIPAWLNEGEAVLPTETNKAYHPTVKAIYDGTIPPDALNGFVKNYNTIKPFIQPDYARIKQSAELKISSDGRMAALLHEQNRKLDENNELQRQTLRALKTMGVNVNMDKNGIAVSVMEVMDQIQKDKKI